MVHADSGTVEDFVRCQKQLATSHDAETLLGVLEYLHSIPRSSLDRNCVKKSKIGKSIGALRKHENSEVKEHARSLVKKWRDILEGPQPSASRSSHSSHVHAHSHLHPHAHGHKGEREGEGKYTPSSSSSSSSSSDATPSREKTKEEATKHFKGQEGEMAKMKLYESVAIHEFTEEEKEMHFLAPEEAAYCIEEAIADSCHTRADKKYQQKARDLIFNLKKNKELVSNLLSRDVHPQRLVVMTNEQLANKEMKGKIQAAKKYEKELSTTITQDDLIDLPDDYEGVYQCRKCKSKRTKYDQLQTRGGDEPMTNIITCFDCKHKWRD
mmetsp:Transcript_30878/g.48105  ORF Transcript_30878/g.48105 Transcript_30878/m.48105 type:complete len:325 (-) Transcript_30878:26-1000(-)